MAERDYRAFFQSAVGGQPYRYQEELATVPVASRVIAVPTGAGKTAAAVIAWLWRRVERQERDAPMRLVYCLPMRTLVEQTRAEVDKWLGRLGWRMPVATIMGGEVEQAWEHHPDRPTILIGTQDLLLSRALNRGYAMNPYRWPAPFGLLSNDCLWICDEVQLMGSGIATTAQLQAWRDSEGSFGKTATWWMSATLNPSWLNTVDFRDPATALPGTSLAPEDRQTNLKDRIEASKPVKELREITPAKVIESHQPGTLTLVILNTVARARDLARSMGRRDGGPGVILLHSRFRAHEREELQKRLREELPPEGRIVIATQVVEAGLDISAHTLITELAPWASLVQRCGRCARTGGAGRIFWAEPPKGEPAPYEEKDLKDGRERLGRIPHHDAAIRNLEQLGPPDRKPHSAVIRLNDLYGLFGTERDLAGGFTDISQYVRDSETDTDVFVFWRDFDGEPGADAPPVEDAELCRAPVHELRRLLEKKATAREWDSEAEKWELRRPDDIRPGMMLMLHSKSGGYDPFLGWSGEPGAAVAPVALSAALTRDRKDSDERSLSGWLPLRVHLSETEEEMHAILTALAGMNLPESDLLFTARWHDLGKLHPRWQQKAIEAASNCGHRAPGPGPWAKFPAKRGSFRPAMRHEAATALVGFRDFIEGRDGWTALSVYLAAAHHGQVRTMLSSRRESDVEGIEPNERVLPALDGWLSEGAVIDFAPRMVGAAGEWDDSVGVFRMRGPSWVSLVLSLLGSDRKRGPHGPFRLAFLEALLAAADARASRRHDIRVAEVGSTT